MGKELVLTLKPIFIGFADILGIDWTLLAGQVMVESSGDPNATGTIGEIGLAQIMLSTAQDRIPNLTEESLYKPEVNVVIQGMYLKWLQYYLHNFYSEDDYGFVLASYNWGIGNVRNLLMGSRTYEDLPGKVKGYVDKVYKLAEMFQDGG